MFGQLGQIAGLLRSISSPVVKTRPGFGQVIKPAKGSVVASPVPASYDPDPDYFFHWFRDSAVVMDALALVRDAVPGARRLFEDFVDFSLALSRLDGRQRAPDWRAALRLTGGQRVALSPRLLPLSVRAAATTAFAGVSTSRNLRLLSEQHSEQHPQQQRRRRKGQERVEQSVKQEGDDCQAQSDDQHELRVARAAGR